MGDIGSYSALPIYKEKNIIGINDGVVNCQ
jgi:hypothetical protein